jgi:hypothetical protein
VFVGDLGDSRRIDFALIGHTVNMAKRLEDSCEPFRLMVGSESISQLSSERVESLKSQKRYLTVKHHSELLEGYEVDPFSNQPQLFAKAVRAYREFAGERVKETRLVLGPEHSSIKVVANGNIPGKILDFSRTGLSVLLPQYLALKVTISLDLELGLHDSERVELIESGVLPIVCEVRWGRPEGSFFRHGLLIKNLTDEKRDVFVRTMTKVSEQKVWTHAG